MSIINGDIVEYTDICGLSDGAFFASIAPVILEIPTGSGVRKPLLDKLHEEGWDINGVAMTVKVNDGKPYRIGPTFR